MSQIAKLLARWFIRRHWGERCEYYFGGCPCCEAWVKYDEVFEYDRNWPNGFFGTVLRQGYERTRHDPDKYGAAKDPAK